MSNRSPRGQTSPSDILLIESEPDDVAPFIDSFEATDRTETVHVVSDATSALDFVHQRGDYADAPRPDLIVLDLHVSDRRGDEILVELNDRPELRRIPVVVVTASDATEDVARSYELNANAYVTKPDTSTEFEELAEAIENFWLRLAHKPPK